MDRNDTICSNQFGFRKNHSTQQAIITLINKITSDVDQGRQSRGGWGLGGSQPPLNFGRGGPLIFRKI